MLQCLRRLFEEKDKVQGYNALKYFTTIIALVLRSLFDLKGHSYWRIVAAVVSGLATIVNTYWDLVLDWGLLQRNSKNKWLRDKLVISNHSVYYVAIVSEATKPFFIDSSVRVFRVSNSENVFYFSITKQNTQHRW